MNLKQNFPLLVFAGLAVLFYVVFPFLDGVVATQFTLVFAGIALLFALFLSVFFFKIDVVHEPAKFLAVLLVWLSTNIVGLPFLIPASSEPIRNGLASLGADAWLYWLLPAGIEHAVKFALVYVLLPTVFLTVAYSILNEKEFTEVVKGNL